MEHRSHARLAALAVHHVELGAEVATRFFDEAADHIVGACAAMARRFELGGRLLVFGAGASASDAHHVAVEFVHPVLVGKRALPALALGDDPSAELAVLGRSEDIILGISVADDGALDAWVARARAAGLLAIRISGGSQPCGERSFVVPSSDAMIVQEVQETLCHVLWELVHVYLDPGGVQ